MCVCTDVCSYFHEADEGLEAETEFVYELELPMDFVPIPRDGEVSKFYLWDIEQVGIIIHLHDLY